MRRALWAFAAVVASQSMAAPGRGDELSGADKLRVIWSNQMSWTPAGIPIVTGGIAEGRDEVAVEAGEGESVRVLPDGDGGAEVRGGARWRVRVSAATKAVVAWHVVVASGRAGDAERLAAESGKWRERGYAPKTFELGTVFGLRGEVIDMRRLVVGIAPAPSVEKARATAREIAARFHVETGVHPVVVERPRGLIEAKDERGTVVKNEGVLWFAPPLDTGTLAIPEVPQTESPGPKVVGAAGGAAGSAERRTYAGKIYVTIGADGRLAVANAVPEDRLLAGLLPAEIGASAPPEALKAQAVAARNELLAKLGTRHLTDPYRLCSRAHCQVYAGAGREDARGQAAIAATRGELLVHPDGTLVDAVYSAACGGHTEDNDRAWGSAPDPSLRGVLDVEEEGRAALASFDPVADVEAFLGALPVLPSCAAAGSFRWTARVEKKTVEDKAGVGRVRDVVLLGRGASGRVVRLRVDGERGAREVSGELEVRRLFGGLKSALFVISIEHDQAGFARAFNFRGGGFGHGVGMCQSGAIGMAEHHHGYRDILSRYYRAATVRRFY